MILKRLYCIYHYSYILLIFRKLLDCVSRDMMLWVKLHVTQSNNLRDSSEDLQNSETYF